MKDRGAEKARDVRRIAQQGIKGNLWSRMHPGYDSARMKEYRRKYGREARRLIDESFNPLTVKSGAICVAADWHIPFYDAPFAHYMVDVCKEFGVNEMAVPGDFWDCDNYSKFVHLGWRDTFKQEIEEVRTVLEWLLTEFDAVYLCRGNHEKRWIDGNYGLMGMEELFALLRVNGNYKVTLDDSIRLESGGKKWLLAHPRNFRQTKLSVAGSLASKYHMNVLSAHGHQWAQGQDTSGIYDLVDAGGLFDPHALEYLRMTNTYPVVQGGFYIIVDGIAVPFKNEDPTHKLGRGGK